MSFKNTVPAFFGAPPGDGGYMLLKIVGIIWIAGGIAGLINPGYIKERLRKKMTGRIKRIVFFFMLCFGFMMASSIFTAPGIAARVAGIIGAVLVIKAVSALTRGTTKSLFNWLGQKSLNFFRVLSAFNIGLGLMFFYS